MSERSDDERLRDLEKIDRQVIGLFGLVSEAASQATDVLLRGDREAARLVVARDQMIDDTYLDIEHLAEHQLRAGSLHADDLRFILAVLRIVPELERSADLAEHIAQGAARGLNDQLPRRMKSLLERMGRVGVEMWHRATDAYAERDGDARDRLKDKDDELDNLHVKLRDETGKLPAPVAVETALIGRFYERLGDHAVNVATHVHYMAVGTH